MQYFEDNEPEELEPVISNDQVVAMEIEQNPPGEDVNVVCQETVEPVLQNKDRDAANQEIHVVATPAVDQISQYPKQDQRPPSYGV